MEFISPEILEPEVLLSPTKPDTRPSIEPDTIPETKPDPFSFPHPNLDPTPKGNSLISK